MFSVNFEAELTKTGMKTVQKNFFRIGMVSYKEYLMPGIVDLTSGLIAISYLEEDLPIKL